jgi:hypothetical protein
LARRAQNWIPVLRKKARQNNKSIIGRDSEITPDDLEKRAAPRRACCARRRDPVTPISPSSTIIPKRIRDCLCAQRAVETTHSNPAREGGDKFVKTVESAARFSPRFGRKAERARLSMVNAGGRLLTILAMRLTFRSPRFRGLAAKTGIALFARRANQGRNDAEI